MLTSTEATASRQYSISLRDALDIAHVENFMDRLVATLQTYERTGQYQSNGITSSEVGALQFRSASGQGYNRNAVESIRIRALEALGFYEQALNNGSSLGRPTIPGARAQQTADSAGATRSSAHQPYAGLQNGFRPPSHSAPAPPFAPGELGFDVPVLEDTISVPIRRPQVAGASEDSATPALFTSELALLFDAGIGNEAHVDAPPVEDAAHNGAFSDSSMSSTGMMDTGDQHAASVEYEAILSPVVFHNFEASPKIIAIPAPHNFTPRATPSPLANSTPANNAPVQAPTVQRSAASPESPASPHSPDSPSSMPLPASARTPGSIAAPSAQSAPAALAPSVPTLEPVAPAFDPQPSGLIPEAATSIQVDVPQTSATQHHTATNAGALRPGTQPQGLAARPGTPARPKPPVDPENPPAISGTEFIDMLSQVLRTKEVLAQRNPHTHSADGTIRVNTTQGTLEVTAVRLHSNGQIYLETKKP